MPVIGTDKNNISPMASSFLTRNARRASTVFVCLTELIFFYSENKYIPLLILADRREKQAYTTECIASTQKGENLEKSSSE